MKAIRYRAYGSPDLLEYVDVERPSPGDDEVLVRVRAAAANPADYHLLDGTLLARPMTGMLRPKQGRPGLDLAGEVVETGRSVTRFRHGDAVFGGGHGAFAEYVSVAESRLAPKPDGLTFQQAAAVPVAGLTALQGLRDKGRIRSGQSVLINGASGGVGTFAVQIAAALGARVTAVCSARNADLVQSIGAERVIDYARDDFTRATERHDLILDCVGNRPVSEILRAVKAEGTLVAATVRMGGRWVGPLPGLLRLIVSSWFVSQRVTFFVASIRAEDLVILKEMIEAGQVAPVIDRSYGLREAAEAIRYLKKRHARGKVVLTVGSGGGE